MMEESVMLKSIHEDSATVTSLCAVVDTCLSLGKLQPNVDSDARSYFFFKEQKSGNSYRYREAKIPEVKIPKSENVGSK